MNLKNIKVGQVIKNYKELCKLLEMEIKSSTNSKKAQLKDLKRYCNYHKEGQKFVIDEIYKECKPKIEKRGKSKGSRQNNNIYGKYIEKLILDLLADTYSNGRKRVYLSQDNLLKQLAMVNENYNFCKFNKKYLMYYISANIDNIKEFYNLNNRNLLDTIERTLNKLNNKCLVMWDKVTTVALDEEITVLGYDDKEYTLKENHRDATSLEKDWIIDAENQILTDMNFKDKQEIYLKDKYKEFRNRVCTKLYEEHKILYYYKSYDINFHKKVIDEKKKLEKYLMEYEERENVKITLNGIVSTNIIKNANKRQDKSVLENEEYWGINISYFDQLKIDRRTDIGYIEDVKNIVSTVINYKTKDLHNEMLKKYEDTLKSKQKQVNKDLLKEII